MPHKFVYALEFHEKIIINQILKTPLKPKSQKEKLLW